jgi:protein SCO1/2
MALVIRFCAVLAAALALVACDRAPVGAAKPSFKAVDITGADYARTLSLPDAEGKTRTLADFKGKVTVLFFGYTQCPDVCPTTMAELAEVKRSLGKDGDRVQGVFVTIDPERDTPKLLKNYITAFDPSFVALRGSDEQTKAVAKEFKVYYAKVEGREPGSYTMDHTAGSFIYDTQGRLRLFTRYGGGAQALASDIKALLAEAGA